MTATTDCRELLQCAEKYSETAPVSAIAKKQDRT